MGRAAPFHLVNVYVRGDSLSEFYAFIFYPLILWALDGMDRSECGKADSRGSSAARAWWLLLPALAFASLVLSHNLSAFIFSPFVLLYLALLSWRETGRGRWRVLARGLLSLGLGLLLSAWYWLPALAELGYVQLGPSTEGFFHYGRHFRSSNLVQDRLLFDYSVAADHGARSPFSMGLAQVVFTVKGGLVLAVRGFRRRLEVRWGFVLFGVLASTVMITPLSRPLWDHLPLLPVVQFPWRFLSVQALFTAAAAAVLVPHEPVAGDLRPAARGWRATARNLQSAGAALLVAALLLASVLVPLHPERLPIGPADVTVERLQLYELFTGNIGTTIRYEWLYEGANPRPYTSDALIEPGVPLRAIPLDGAQVEASLVEREPTRRVWRVSGEGGGMAFPVHYWPGWQARVDGERAEVWAVQGSGTLALQVPAGEHTVTLRLGRTPVRAAAEALSLISGVALVVIVAGRAFRGRAVRRRSLALAACCLSPVVVSIVILLVVFRQPAGPVDASDLTMDFDHMPYLHHNPTGVDFEGAARLTGYSLSAEELAPGDELAVRLDWAEADDVQTAVVRLVSPAAVRYDVEPLAEAACSPQATDCDVLTLQLPHDTPRGVYLLQLRLFGRERELHALTTGGRTQAILYLRPVRLIRGPTLLPESSVQAPFGRAIRLLGATISQPASDRLAVRLTWSAVQPVAANYGISLRLLDDDDQAVVKFDTQPGYGFLPTSTWRSGELVADRYTLALPQDLPAGEGYRLQVVLYQVSTLVAVGEARLGEFRLPMETPVDVQRPPRSFVVPTLENRVAVDFGGQVRLVGFDLQQGDDDLSVMLWWQATQVPGDDYTVFVHLFDPATEELFAQSDAMPRRGAYPTSWWAAGEVVSETVTLPLAEVPEGVYGLAVGLYDRTVTRLVAIGPGGNRVPDDRLILPAEVVVGR
jgi:hypothetical protein